MAANTSHQRQPAELSKSGTREISSFSRRDVLRMTLAITGGAACTYGVGGSPALLLPADAAVSKARLDFQHSHQVVQSTGNLYWTENEENEHSASHSLIWRASKSTDGKRLIFARRRDNGLWLGQPTWSKVGAGWFGFVSARFLSHSEIWRFDLADIDVAPVTVARPARLVDQRWIVADGTHVYWVDATGIRRARVFGGSVQTVTSGSQITHLRLDRGYLHYVSAGRKIRRVRIAGGQPTTLVSTAAPAPLITQLKVKNGWMVWANASSAITKRPSAGGSVQTLLASRDGVGPFDFDGINTVHPERHRHWTGSWRYSIVSYASGRSSITTNLAEPASRVLADPTGINWVQNNSTWRLDY